MRCLEFSILLLLIGCTGGPDFGGQEGSEVTDDSDTDTDIDTDTDTDTDADTDTDTDSDTDTDTDTDFPGSLAGELRYQYGRSAAPEPPLECDLLWGMAGTPRAASAACPDCEFSFDVALTLDKSSTSSKACADVAELATLPLAYSTSLGAVVVDYGTSYYTLGAATFDGTTLSFAGGAVSEPVGGYYETRYWSGTAVVK